MDKYGLNYFQVCLTLRVGSSVTGAVTRLFPCVDLLILTGRFQEARHLILGFAGKDNNIISCDSYLNNLYLKLLKAVI